MHRPQQLERGLGLGNGVERRNDAALILAAPVAMAQLPLGFLLLDVAAIGQQHGEQIDARLGGIDRPAVAKHGQARQQAGMVDMGVGEQDEVDLADIEAEIERPHILLAGLRPTLEHAAIDQKTDVVRFDQGTGASYFTGCSEKG